MSTVLLVFLIYLIGMVGESFQLGGYCNAAARIERKVQCFDST